MDRHHPSMIHQVCEASYELIKFLIMVNSNQDLTAIGLLLLQFFTFIEFIIINLFIFNL